MINSDFINDKLLILVLILILILNNIIGLYRKYNVEISFFIWLLADKGRTPKE
jgi:hypothetical protein